MYTDSPRYAISADLENTGIAVYEDRPGVRGFTGRLRADWSGGRLEIRSQDMVVDLGSHLTESIPVDLASGTVIWRRSGERITVLSDNIAISNADLAMTLGRYGEAVANKSGGRGYVVVSNTDRSVGATLSGVIARSHGDRGMDDAPLTIEMQGTAGQSFGAFNAGGLKLVLTGDANDYVGKGMAGGMLVIRPPLGVSYKSHESVIIGNTCLYGATGGRLYAAGRAGERFAVRNSGARVVVEGIGDNGCEYMTGGVVTILGETGINFGAGMTGGFAYVFDEFNRFEERVNTDLVDVLPMKDLNLLREHLRGIVDAHLNETGSERAEMMLDDFPSYCERFKLVKPKGLRVEDLLGKRGRSANELLLTTQ